MPYTCYRKDRKHPFVCRITQKEWQSYTAGETFQRDGDQAMGFISIG